MAVFWIDKNLSRQSIGEFDIMLHPTETTETGEQSPRYYDFFASIEEAQLIHGAKKYGGRIVANLAEGLA